MKNVIIHIGYPKTATSWLQNNYYPHITNYQFISRQEFHKMIISSYALGFDPEKAYQYFKKKYNDNIIISEENIVGTTSNFGLNGYMTKEHALRLYNTFPDAKIILFIRNQTDMIASTYAEYFQGGGTYGINKYLHGKNVLANLFMFSYEYLEYQRTIQLYQNLFGKRNTCVFLYEEFQTNPLQFIGELCRSFNFQVNMKDIDFKIVNRRYRSFFFRTARIKNIFTKKKMHNKYYLVHIPYWFEYTKKISNKLNKYQVFGKHPDSIDILGKKNFNYIRDYYKESNRILCDDMQLSKIKEYNYPL